jgi:hypothetical protein
MIILWSTIFVSWLGHLRSSHLWMWSHEGRSLYPKSGCVSYRLEGATSSYRKHSDHCWIHCALSISFGPSKCLDHKAGSRSNQNEAPLLGSNHAEPTISVLCPTRGEHWQSGLLSVLLTTVTFSNMDNRAFAAGPSWVGNRTQFEPSA